MKTLLRLIVLLLLMPLILLPEQASACEPIPALLEVVQGSLPLTHSLAITAGVVAFKMILFAFWQNSVPRAKALVLMFFGNLVSWVFGCLIAFLVGTMSSFMIYGAILTWPIFLLPARRIKKLAFFAVFHRFSAKRIATYMTLGFFLSGMLFLFSDISYQQQEYAEYWVLKIIAIYLALSISIVFSALWEEITVWKLSKQPPDFQGFFEPVLKANLATLFLLMLSVAILSLPQRVESPWFIAKQLPVKEDGALSVLKFSQ